LDRQKDMEDKPKPASPNCVIDEGGETCVIQCIYSMLAVLGLRMKLRIRSLYRIVGELEILVSHKTTSLENPGLPSGDSARLVVRSSWEPSQRVPVIVEGIPIKAIFSPTLQETAIYSPRGRHGSRYPIIKDKNDRMASLKLRQQVSGDLEHATTSNTL